MLLDIVARIVSKDARPESLVSNARRIVCARTVVCVIRWMGHVNVLVIGLVSTVMNVMSTD